MHIKSYDLVDPMIVPETSENDTSRTLSKCGYSSLFEYGVVVCTGLSGHDLQLTVTLFGMCSEICKAKSW